MPHAAEPKHRSAPHIDVSGAGDGSASPSQRLDYSSWNFAAPANSCAAGSPFTIDARQVVFFGISEGFDCPQRQTIPDVTIWKRCGAAWRAADVGCRELTRS